MRRVLSKILDTFHTTGIKGTFATISSWLLKYGIADRRLQRVKRTISDRESKALKGKVVSGPFDGMRFANDGWGGPEYFAMLVGAYEIEVQEMISKVCGSIVNFIDVGAASGYYAVGVPFRFRGVRSFAYELSEKSRQICKDNAISNGVIDRLQIFGKFDGSLPADIKMTETLFLFDIEGAEYELLDEAFVSMALGAHFIVELHGDDQGKIDALARLFGKSNHVSLINRSIGKVHEKLLNYKLTENELNLLSSDGRDRPGKWLAVCPSKLKEMCYCRFVV